MLTSSVSRLCMIFWCRVLFLQIPSKDQRHSKDCKDSNRSEQGILTPCHKNSQSGTDMIKFMKIFVSFILCVCVCVSIFLIFSIFEGQAKSYLSLWETQCFGEVSLCSSVCLILPDRKKDVILLCFCFLPRLLIYRVWYGIRFSDCTVFFFIYPWN